MSRSAAARSITHSASTHSSTTKKPTLTVVEGRKDYPKTEVEDPVRPFRIWDTDKRAYVQYRYFAIAKNAHVGALIEARWAAVGTVLEVIDARTAKLLGQYKRQEHTITFMR